MDRNNNSKADRRCRFDGGGAGPCAPLLALALLVACAEGDGSSRAATRDPAATPLHLAAADGDSARVRTLLAEGAQVEGHDGEEWTALHRAAQGGSSEVVGLLLQAGAAVDARGRYDMRPLHWAVQNGHLEVVRALLEGGAELDATNLYGMTALHLAPSAEVTRLLLERGAQLDARDVRGMTPLHFARTKEVAKVLLDRGADVGFKDRRGLTPMDMSGVADCPGTGLVVYPARETVRLRQPAADLSLLVWNVTESPMLGLGLEVESPAATASVTPARIASFRPAQMTEIVAAFQRRDDIPVGKHRLTLRFTTEAGEVARCALALDTRAGLSPEERGMIPIGAVALREQPAWTQYLAFAAAPLVVVLLWLGWRWRERGAGRE